VLPRSAAIFWSPKATLTRSQAPDNLPRDSGVRLIPEVPLTTAALAAAVKTNAISSQIAA